ncbi:hypothetical protein PHMEG_0007337 [Phytophthora megakarya]|uniref:Uncharacterized protein n=1 Tax=Phytophthora megakarya TaxID=4795 RepID=A0A225WLI5_9STRA|nr:hypothetical protein PHMEG_0007337 [Phytophthora megakarya]
MESSDEELFFLLDDDDDLLAAAFVLACAEQEPRSSKSLIRGGSQKGKPKNILRNIASGHAALVRDYLGEHPVHEEKKFRRRHCVDIPTFTKICETLSSRVRYFQQHPDAVELKGASVEQKVPDLLHMLSERNSADAQDPTIIVFIGSGRHALTYGKTIIKEKQEAHHHFGGGHDYGLVDLA